MTQKRYRVFFDTSVIITAIFSSTGGARKLFYLAEADIIDLLAGENVLRETDEVLRRKVPGSLPLLAQLLTISRIANSPAPTQEQLTSARKCVTYMPDAYILAEAIQARPDWFVTHDKEHFLNQQKEIDLPFEIGTPGDFIQRLKKDMNIF